MSAQENNEIVVYPYDLNQNIRDVTILCGYSDDLDAAILEIKKLGIVCNIVMYPENGLHPHEQIMKAVRIVEDAAKPVIVLTHSPYMAQMLVLHARDTNKLYAMGDVLPRTVQHIPAPVKQHVGGIRWTHQVDVENSSAYERLTEPMQRIQLLRDWNKDYDVHDFYANVGE